MSNISQKTILCIDPSVAEETIFVLIQDGKMTTETVQGSHRDLLILIEQFLSKNNLLPKDIQSIGVVVGAGRFTSTRIAATIANTWHLVHDTRVFPMHTEYVHQIISGSVTFEEPSSNGYLSPEYSAPPSIGK